MSNSIMTVIQGTLHFCSVNWQRTGASATNTDTVCERILQVHHSCWHYNDQLVTTSSLSKSQICAHQVE